MFLNMALIWYLNVYVLWYHFSIKNIKCFKIVFSLHFIKYRKIIRLYINFFICLIRVNFYFFCDYFFAVHYQFFLVGYQWSSHLWLQVKSWEYCLRGWDSSFYAFSFPISWRDGAVLYHIRNHWTDSELNHAGEASNSPPTTRVFLFQILDL